METKGKVVKIHRGRAAVTGVPTLASLSKEPLLAHLLKMAEWEGRRDFEELQSELHLWWENRVRCLQLQGN